MSFPKNDPAFDYLDYYLDKAPYGEGAVLITGPWGSGKSRTIRAYMDARDKRLLRAEPLGDKHVYVSLYGVSSLEQVLERLFAARHPRLGTGPVKFVATIMGWLANAWRGNSVFATSDAAKVQDYLLSLRNTVLVIDDLERAQMPASVIMGYLNTFIEHQKVKALIIANEREIDWPGFSAQKEKLIARTVRVASDCGEAYDYFVSRMGCDEARLAAADAKTSALATFAVADLNNLRSLRAALDDFNRLVENADPALRGAKEALVDILPMMVAIWSHLRSGAVKAQDLIEDTSLIYESMLGNQSDKEKLGPASQMIQRHPEVNWLDSVISISLLAELAGSGNLRTAEIDEQAKVHRYVVGLTSVPAWRRLWRWTELALADFRKMMTDLQEDLQQRRITDPGIILHVYASMLEIKRHGGDEFGGDLDGYLRSYVELLDADEMLEPFASSFDTFDTLDSYAGLGFASLGEADFIAYRTHLAGILNKQTERKLKYQSVKVLERLRHHDFALLYSYGDNTYYQTPVLHHIPVSEFVDVFLQDGIIPPGFNRALRDRYGSHPVLDHPLMIERDWFVEMIEEAKARAQALPQPQLSWASDRIAILERDVRKNLGLEARKETQ